MKMASYDIICETKVPATRHTRDGWTLFATARSEDRAQSFVNQLHARGIAAEYMLVAPTRRRDVDD
jgi:hypothetical protein